MKKILILVIVIFLASCTQENVKARMTVSYELREKALIFSDTKMGQYGLIETIYDSKNYSYGQYGTVFDIEHIYLDSLLKSSEMKNDLYNLRFATLAINRQRANLPFVDKDNGGAFGIVGNGFYPGDDDKGDVARALMYMAQTYDLDLKEMIDVKVALKWHKEDPVDDFERHRADVIKSIQGNENPFIEDSKYAEDTYGSKGTGLWIVIGVLVVVTLFTNRKNSF